MCPTLGLEKIILVLHKGIVVSINVLLVRFIGKFNWWVIHGGRRNTCVFSSKKSKWGPIKE